MNKRKYYYNETDLRKALVATSEASPQLYVYAKSTFAEAFIVTMKRLNPQAPTDAMILSDGRSYWKNGKQKKFTQKQIIADQQIGWKT